MNERKKHLYVVASEHPDVPTASERRELNLLTIGVVCIVVACAGLVVLADWMGW